MSQFTYNGNDLVEIDYQKYDPSTLIMALLAIESSCPGTLFNILRQGALANGGWHITSNVTDPVKSITDQQAFEAWLDQFQSALDSQDAEGGLDYE